MYVLFVALMLALLLAIMVSIELVVARKRLGSWSSAVKYLRAVLHHVPRTETGGVDIGGLMLMGLGMVFIAVGFILFPVVIEGAEESRTATGVGNYTGLTSIIEVGPTIALVAFLFGGVVAGYFGIKMMRGA